MTTTNFLGIPVSGDITHGYHQKKQRPIEELQPIIQAVLDDPTIVEFGWRQYTPYFNDGEPCEFSVHGTWVRTDAEVDTEEEAFDEYDLEIWGHPSLGKVNGHYEGEWPNRKYIEDGYEGPDRARYDRIKALEKAIEGDEFNNVLLEAFGDHAAVTVRRDGIEVESYDHE